MQKSNIVKYRQNGYDCIIRKTNDDNYCCYVSLAKQKNKNIDCSTPDFQEKLFNYIDKNGGITFLGHLANEVDPKQVFWIGFDLSKLQNVKKKNYKTAKKLIKQFVISFSKFI